MSGAAESLSLLIGTWLAGGLVLGLLGYLSTLWGFATLLRIGFIVRLPALSRAEAGRAAAEGPRAAIGRQNAGLLLLSVGLALILTACAVEAYIYALLVHAAAA